MTRARLFVLYRREDVSGVSGTGIVADGIVYPDGRCSYRWRSGHATTVAADSIEQVEAVHGHDGRTVVVFVDDVQEHARADVRALIESEGGRI